MTADDDLNGARIPPMGIVPHKRNGLNIPHAINDLFGDQFQSQMLVHYPLQGRKEGMSLVGKVLDFVVFFIFREVSCNSQVVELFANGIGRFSKFLGQPIQISRVGCRNKKFDQ